MSTPRTTKCRGQRYDMRLNANVPTEYEIIVWAEHGDYWLFSAVGDRGPARVEHIDILRYYVLELQEISICQKPKPGDTCL